MTAIDQRRAEPRAQIFLLPGTLHCSAEHAIIATILGSCVAVCLWDCARGNGGMNHFLLPRASGRDADERYGDIAIERLIETMSRLGSRRTDLQAKVLGGANVLPFGASAVTVGGQNVAMAMDALRCHRVPVVAHRVGGERGIKIWLDTRSGEVAVRPLSRRAHVGADEKLKRFCSSGRITRDEATSVEFGMTREAISPAR